MAVQVNPVRLNASVLGRWCAGDTVTIGVRDFTNTIIARNGSNIMGLAENLTIDAAYTTIDFVYINASIGWNVQ